MVDARPQFAIMRKNSILSSVTIQQSALRGENLTKLLNAKINFLHVSVFLILLYILTVDNLSKV